MTVSAIETEPETEKNETRLRLLFPEAFSDGRLNVDTLLQLIGQVVEDDNEKYGLGWFGKRNARQAALTPSTGTLRPRKDESANWSDTKNLFIQGDNLDALKLLQKSYYGRVKMVYIDPPYNTGKDFIYPDNYRDSIANYKQITNQTDDAGLRTTSESEIRGRIHTIWLNMMYPRLKLARNLLRNDGVLFMSIDEREVSNARLLLAEIFGEQNAVAEFIWHAKKGGSSDKGGVVSEHEYVLCFARDASTGPLGTVEVAPEELDRTDEKGPYRRGRELNKWGANSLRRDRPTMWFPVTGPDGEDVYPVRGDGKEGCWRRGRKQMLATVASGDAEFVRRDDDRYVVYEKIRNTDARAKPHRTILSDVGQTADGTKAIKALFDGEKLFDFTKPPALIKTLIELAAPPEPDPDGSTEFIILDFFAGSGTTAQAVMELNAEDNAERRYICVQLPETLDPKSPTQVAAYNLCKKLGLQPNIAEVSKERIRRAARIWVDEPIDTGFRVLELDSSNLKEWDTNTDDIEASILASLDHVKDDRTEEDLLFEVMLRLGIEPTAHIDSEVVAGHAAYVVPAGPIIACLNSSYEAQNVAQVADTLKALVGKISDGRDVTIVLRDTAFVDDVAKSNLIAALDQSAISNVKTI